MVLLLKLRRTRSRVDSYSIEQMIRDYTQLSSDSFRILSPRAMVLALPLLLHWFVIQTDIASAGPLLRAFYLRRRCSVYRCSLPELYGKFYIFFHCLAHYYLAAAAGPVLQWGRSTYNQDCMYTFIFHCLVQYLLVNLGGIFWWFSLCFLYCTDCLEKIL